MIFSIFPWFDLPGKMDVPLNLIIILFWLGTPGSIHPIFRPASQPWQQDSQVLLQGNGWKSIWAWVRVHLPDKFWCFRTVSSHFVLDIAGCLDSIYYMIVFTILYDLIKILGYPGLSSVCQTYQQEMVRSQTRLPSTSKPDTPVNIKRLVHEVWMFIHLFMWKIPGVEITVLTIPATGCLSWGQHDGYADFDLDNESQVDGSECLMLRWSHPREFSSQVVKY